DYYCLSTDNSDNHYIF
nr:immunoglobulin light chain junction region [Macaca mulatta]MOW07512.1 immunoglobulin light chain junction region [Macaca mulatta]